MENERPRDYEGKPDSVTPETPQGEPIKTPDQPRYVYRTADSQGADPQDPREQEEVEEQGQPQAYSAPVAAQNYPQQGAYPQQAYGQQQYGQQASGQQGAYDRAAHGQANYEQQGFQQAQPEQSYSQPFGYASQVQTAPRKPTKKGPGWGALIVAMLLAAFLAVGGTIATLKFSGAYAPAASSQQIQQPSGEKTPTVQVSGEGTDWQAVANAVRPATVSIQVSTGDGGDTGSGVVWDSNGNIVTNYHVVSAAVNNEQAKITVRASGSRLYEAEIVGIDPTTDLAVIRMKNPPADLVAGNFGDSSQLKVGEAVMAIGSPLGLTDTVTTGIVSALDRPVAVKTAVPNDQSEEFNYQFPYFLQQSPQSETVVTNAIQVDASINPGNSGGPLFDAQGRVIGINSSIASMGKEGSAGSIGLGFAIPVNLVKNVVTQLIEKGEAVHAQLGVSISTAAVQVGEETRLGAKVESVLPGGAAADANLRVGDVIVSIDGNDVVSSAALTGFVRRYNSGDTVTLGIARGGEITEVQVALKAK
ncbi:MAG: trypsin-like peptidase domain-containing protein [Actinomyces sp.]|nr:trypsin-like peptidase domain-containing protein [Actinomyces sp.]